MAIILPRETSPWEGLASGIGGGLQALAQGKMKQIERRDKLMKEGLAALEKHRTGAELSDIAKNVYGVELTPQFLATKAGQQYLSSLQKGEQQIDIAHQKASLKPYTVGEAALKGLSFVNMNRPENNLELRLLKSIKHTRNLKKNSANVSF